MTWEHVLAEDASMNGGLSRAWRRAGFVGRKAAPFLGVASGVVVDAVGLVLFVRPLAEERGRRKPC